MWFEIKEKIFLMQNNLQPIESIFLDKATTLRQRNKKIGAVETDQVVIAFKLKF